METLPPYLRCLACGATRDVPEDEPIEVSVKWLDEHERGQIVFDQAGVSRDA